MLPLDFRILVFVFTKIFGTNLDDMVENLELGDVSETVCSSYERSTKCPPNKKSTLSLQEVIIISLKISRSFQYYFYEFIFSLINCVCYFIYGNLFLIFYSLAIHFSSRFSLK